MKDRETSVRKLTRRRKKEHVSNNRTKQAKAALKKQHGADRGLERKIKIFTPGAETQRAASQLV